MFVHLGAGRGGSHRTSVGAVVVTEPGSAQVQSLLPSDAGRETHTGEPAAA